MDSLLELLNQNKEWLFSGVGVVILTFIGRLVWGIRHPPAVPQSPTVLTPQAETLPEPKTIPTPLTEYTKVEMERAFITKRVHVGDYLDIYSDAGHRKIRITVKGLSELDIPHEILDKPEREDVVAITVDLGGAIAYCGSSVKQTSVNEFLVPQLKGNEALRSVFSLLNLKDYSSLIRIAVEHINCPAGTVDINVVHLVGLFR